MRTLGDRVLSVYRNYIAPSKKDVKIGKKEEQLVAGDLSFPEQKLKWGTKELSMEQCIKVADQCPLFMKGAKKKARDSIRAWHRVETIDKTKKPFKDDMAYIDHFIRRNNLKKLWEIFRVAAFITGDAYLLITFSGDAKTELHDPPTKNACPYKVRLLDSTFIKEIGYYPKEAKKYGKLLVEHFHYEDVKENKDYWIHPDRIIHMENDKLFGRFGHSKANLLRNILKSTVNVDIATGEILAWFAHGAYDIMQEGLTEPEEKKWRETVDKHPGAYIHNETAKLQAIVPQAIDPEHFYDYLILCIAASFFMPTHILTGIQVGKVTGAEVGTGDYVKDLKDDQELDYSPLLDRLYSMILKAKGKKWDFKYEIVWNPIYIDELSEAEILGKRVIAAEQAFNGARGAGGFIDMEEARRIFNTGQIHLDENKKIKVKEPMNQGPEAPKPSDDDEDDDKPAKKPTKAANETGTDLYKFQLDASAKAMIENRKKQWKKEKELGNEVLEEQDDKSKD